jgi:hypothetical protein
MTGAELKSIREAYGLSASAMGRVLGYNGPKANVAFTSAGLSETPAEYRPQLKSSL